MSLLKPERRPGQPVQVSRPVQALLFSEALGVALLALWRVPDPSHVNAFAITLTFALTVAIARGHSWARFLFAFMLVIGAVVTIPFLPALLHVSPGRTAVFVVQTAIQVTAVFWLFSAESVQWFRTPRIAAQAKATLISRREILRGALVRTAPAALLGFAFLIGISNDPVAQVTIGSITASIAWSLSIAGGGALAVCLLRSRLRDDAAVAGRRAFIVGLAALGLGCTIQTFLMLDDALTECVLMFASGMLVGGAMFLPWVQLSRPVGEQSM